MTSSPWPDEVGAILRHVDPALTGLLHAQWREEEGRPPLPLPREGRVVLVGHRAAGKSSVLPGLAARLGRTGVDLDHEIARGAGMPVRELYTRDPAAFRRLERETFLALPPGVVVAAGGGFLSHHGEVLAAHLAVLVPITYATYRARLMADVTRPRLQPDATRDVEIAAIWAERERRHAQVATVPLMAVLARGMR